jgi:hypothetical protein
MDGGKITLFPPSTKSAGNFRNTDQSSNFAPARCAARNGRSRQACFAAIPSSSGAAAPDKKIRSHASFRPNLLYQGRPKRPPHTFTEEPLMLRSNSARAALLASFLALGLAYPACAEESQSELPAPPLPGITEELPLPEGEMEGDESYYGLGLGSGCGLKGGTPGGGTLIEGTGGCGAPIGWTIQADILFLRRDENSVVPLVNGDTPFGIEALDLSWRAGPRVSVIRHSVLGSAWDVEALYFGIDGWQEVAASANATTFFTNPNINFAATTVTTNYREALYNIEFNLRRPCSGDLTFITGFRWIELKDNLFTDIVGSSHTIDVNNYLWGYQIGGEWRMLSHLNFDVVTWGKAGIYHNAADQGTSIVNVGGAVPNFGAQGTNVAFVGEVGVYGAYRFAPWGAVRAGYQAMWLDGVATAPNQIATSNVATGVATMDFGETLLYHGGFAGLEFYW